MVELFLLAPQNCVEPVSDALIDELGALSVSVEDADARDVEKWAELRPQVLAGFGVMSIFTVVFIGLAVRAVLRRR